MKKLDGTRYTGEMTHRLVLPVVALATSLLAFACVDGRGKPVSEPEFYAKNVKAYADTATGLPPDVAYGWDVTVAGDVARWRECTAVDACGQVERTRPKRELLGIQHVADTEVEGQHVEVIKLSLAPRPTYIVPTWKQGR